MRTIQLPLMVARAKSTRIIVAVCLLVIGFSSHGICVKLDGASHVATPDHLCCDPPPPSPGVPEVTDDTEGSDPLHGCTHVPLVQSTLASTRTDYSFTSPVLTCVRLQGDLILAEATALDLEGSRRLSGLTPLSPTRLRL